MTHKITIANLVLDFKRKNEGKGVTATRALSTLMAICLAFNAPLPNVGKTGAQEAARQVLRPYLTKITSDVNELMHIDYCTVDSLTVAIYCNRYEQAWNPRGAIDAFSIQQIVAEGIGDDIWETVRLWLDRFMSAVEFYQMEAKEGE
ncbi:hypothetical protein PHOBOS_49 [Erwinia phage vB_EamM_Phobos]|uniref:hypothetical protein n=1 Tax=Erwinia phage vB_EamM_Phobos TaxID=1883377 RepID=UPI00081CF3A3|nr:hypothetical protein BIZ79_gp049 [Erwinia phage vB_EamM_Phobos]ANZ50239.1 hypothetical protein PHOBOS_49 [Erwinia phage vB_EamM_Phobos]